MASFSKRGSRWCVRVRIPGYPTQSHSFATKAAAKKWASETESEMSRGVFVSRAEAERTTLKEALERFNIEISPTRKDGGVREKSLIRRWLESNLAPRSLASITSTDVARYRDKRLKTDGVSAATVRLEMMLLSRLFNIAVREWGIGGLINPIPHVTKPRLPPGRDRRVSLEELKFLIAACRKTDLPELESLIVLAVETSMRLSELLGMQWRYVDLKRGTVRLFDTKNGENRDVALSPNAISELEQMPRSITGRVFTRWSKADGFEHIWRKTIKRAKALYVEACTQSGERPDLEFLNNLRFHDLRHEATSRLFELGLNVMEVASMTGHKDLKILKRYTHLRAEDVSRKIRQRLAAQDDSEAESKNG